MSLNKSMLGLGSFLLLQACGANVVIKEDTASASATGKTAIAEINEFYDKVYQSQDELAVSLLASHVSCRYGNSVVLRSYKPGSKVSSDDFCLNDDELKKWQMASPSERPRLGTEMELAPFDRTMVRASLEYLNAFSDYLDALAKLAVHPETPIAGYVEKAVLKLAETKKGLALMQESAIKQEQIAAITSLATYLEGIARNMNDVKKIKEIVKLEGQRQEELVAQTAINIDLIFHTYSIAVSDAINQNLGDYYNSNREKKEFDGLDKKRSYLASLLKQRQFTENMKISSSPGADAVRLFVAAHRNMRNALDGNYSATQMERITDENIKELKDNLKSLGELAKLAIAI